MYLANMGSKAVQKSFLLKKLIMFSLFHCLQCRLPWLANKTLKLYRNALRLLLKDRCNQKDIKNLEF